MVHITNDLSLTKGHKLCKLDEGYIAYYSDWSERPTNERISKIFDRNNIKSFGQIIYNFLERLMKYF